jgi:hypothetical protein
MTELSPQLGAAATFAPAPLNRLAALAGVLVLIADIAGGMCGQMPIPRPLPHRKHPGQIIQLVEQSLDEPGLQVPPRWP